MDQKAISKMATEASDPTSQTPPLSIISPTTKPDAGPPISWIDNLASEIKQKVLQNLSYSDLKQMEQVSRSWSSAIEALKQHQNSLVTHKYALEASYFGSRMVDGWLVPRRATMDKEIKVRPEKKKDFFPVCKDPAQTEKNYNRMGTNYVRFLASYRAEYERLCSLVLGYVKKARPGLRLDRKALHRVLLEWNTFRWRGHRCYPIPVLASAGEHETSESVILDFLPPSLLAILESRVGSYQNSRERWGLPVPKQASKW